MYKASVMLLAMELKEHEMVRLDFEGYAEPMRIGESDELLELKVSMQVPCEHSAAMKIGQNFNLTLAPDPQG